jgi:hypothetical protein
MKRSLFIALLMYRNLRLRFNYLENNEKGYNMLHLLDSGKRSGES